MKALSQQTKIALAFAAVAVLVLGGIVAFQAATSPEPADASEQPSIAVRDDSRRLDTADDGKVTLVEFLDFECESCAAAYPFVEGLRETYAGRVTFVVRYFPLPSHQNARNAAHAVESAARQDALEGMYRRMYETQAEWGESRESQAALFRTFAADLGLDMEQYDRDVDSEAVAARVQADVDDGLSLGVDSTPTFFLNGTRLNPSTTAEFTAAIDEALAE